MNDLNHKPRGIKSIYIKVVNYLLAFFVSYGVFQSNSISLKLKNYYIIGLLFLGLCGILAFHVFSKDNRLYLLPSKKRNTIWNYIKPIDYLVLLFLIINSIWILFIPALNGFSIGDAVSEAGMLITFVLYFPLAILIRLKEIDFKFILKVFKTSTFILAFFYCVIWLSGAIKPGNIDTVFSFFKKIPFLIVGEYIKGWGIIRFTISNTVLLGSGLLLFFLEKKPLSICSALQIVIYVVAILGTFLKSLWFGILTGIAIIIIYSICLIFSKKEIAKKQIKNILIKSAYITLIVLILDVTLFQGAVTNRFLNSFLNTGGINQNCEEIYFPENCPENSFDAEEDRKGAIISNNIKIEQTKKLVKHWLESPLAGFGYGSYIPNYFRSETQLFVYEMTFFSLLMKLGIIGILAWLSLFVGALVLVVKSNISNLFYIIMWTAIAITFVITIQTNPLLFTANSINLIIFLILFGVYSSSIEQTSEDIK